MRLVQHHAQKYSFDTMAAAIKLQDQGRSCRAIGRELGVPWTTVRSWLNGTIIRAARIRLEGVS